MLMYEDALRIALEQLRQDEGLVASSTRELPFGWFFVAQSKQFLETGEVRHMAVGSGGFVVDRETGRVHEFGSAFTTERNLRMYGKGFRFASYDLTITKVYDLKTTARLLQKLDMTYVEPEEAHGVVWRIPKHYRASQLEKFLRQLPYTFTDYNFHAGLEVFEELDAAGCCTYELREHRQGPPS